MGVKTTITTIHCYLPEKIRKIEADENVCTVLGPLQTSGGTNQ